MKLKKKYGGVVVPMITPFTERLMVDEDAVCLIVDGFLKNNIYPFVSGTTGESVSMTDKQKAVLVKKTVDHVAKRTTVYVGISGNCLQDSIDSAKLYADMGADVLVAHLPFYYPINADQMLRYFEQMANNLPRPLILYNIPITTKQSIPLDVIEKLSYHDNIIGIKDSERGIERLDESLKLWKDRQDFIHLMGAAVQSAHALLNGSDGIIPSTGNLTPSLYSQMIDAAFSGNVEKTNDLQDLTNQISEVYQKDKILSQSIPALKVMMDECNLCKPYVLSPMYETPADEQKTIRLKTRVFLDKIKN